ncbi:hypothetical protein I0Q91_05500 [Halanaerobiaceae bacterium Z-7014]|uniref:Uncharacterized protein n=1 Tax=Halonatronomonas betaini TaxID=2778430 RepID=A0A931AXB0_9FIRM|nr:hypothetical protein [Halonatronomonas betaini]
MVWKKLYNRNKLLTITQDKFLYRKYIKDKLGSKKANDILVPLIHSTKEPESISFNSLPDEYIIKPNNAAGRYFIKRKEDKINKETIIKNCKEWLSKVYGIKLHEWAYKDIEPRILIEKLITDENGSIADDYKFFCYNGKCKFVQVISNRHVDEKRSIYTSDWEFLDIKYKGYRSVPGVIKPKNYNKMIEIAEVLSKDFNFVRIDMYNINGNIFFGEFTHYPVSGHGKIEPVDYDYEFGKYWDINKDEARK